MPDLVKVRHYRGFKGGEIVTADQSIDNASVVIPDV